MSISLTRIYLKDFYDSALFTYRYPVDQGFPVYRLEQAELAQDGNCYFCDFSDQIPPVTQAYALSHLTVYGEYMCKYVCKDGVKMV